MFPRRLNQGIPIAAPQSATPADGSGGSFLSVEIFCAVNVPNSAIAMRDRAARTQGGTGVRHTRDFRPVFWTHRDPLIHALRAAGAHYGARARCLRVALGISGGAVTPVSTGRPLLMCKKLQLFAKIYNKINNLSDFWIFRRFWGLEKGRGWGKLFALPHFPLLSPILRIERVLHAQQLVQPRLDVVLGHLIDVRVDV